MNSLNQRHASPNHYLDANMFARNITKNNDFIKAFGNTPTNNHTLEQPQSDNYGLSGGSNFQSINTDESSFFDFEPFSRTESPYQNLSSTPGASALPWNNQANIRAFTPPSSASSPKSWPYNGYQHGNPSNILTNIDPANTRAQYGQFTPPKDDNDNESLPDYQLCEQLEQRELHPPQAPQAPEESGKGKRKRNYKNNDSTVQSPPKRVRKYASRGTTNLDESTKPEDVKRSKFLERNRIAASKCRQKKKEWTQSLENRARELQTDNNQLRLVVESCRQEVLFLKGELLKHSNCECEPIRTFLESGADNFVGQKLGEDLFSREISPVESKRPSPACSTDARSGRSISTSTSPSTEPSCASIAKDDHTLEALLTSSLKHDTSDEGIDSQMAMAVAA